MRRERRSRTSLEELARQTCAGVPDNPFYDREQGWELVIWSDAQTPSSASRRVVAAWERVIAATPRQSR